MSKVNRHIYLIGFMGCGKTSVSIAMNQLYGKNLVEVDDRIIAKEGRSINQIFAESGENYFRDLETEMLKELADEDNIIVSCGGGMVLREENRRLMKENGVIIWLDATPETILDRVKDDDSRPNLKGKKNVKDIEALKNKRADAYAEAADIKVDTDGKTIREVAKEIYESVNRTR